MRDANGDLLIFKRIKNRNVRSGLGVIFVLLGLVLGALPVLPGMWLVIFGFELLGIHILSMDAVKRGVRYEWDVLLKKLRIR